MAGIPKSFFPFLTEFADFSRKKVRINTIGKDTANPGELTTILLPEAKLDMSTFALGGFVTCAGVGAAAMTPAVEQLIEQIMIEVGSVQLHPSFSFYGQVWGMFSDLQGSWTKSNIRSILNLQPVPAAAGAAPTPANQTLVPFQIHQWLGAMNDIKILPADRCPPIRLTIRWAQNNVLAGGTGVTGASYSLSGLYALLDEVKMPGVYDELLSKKIAQSPLQMPYTNYQVIPGTQGGLTNVVRWSSTSDSLQKVYGTFIPQTYQSLAQVMDSTTFLSPAFTRGSPNLGKGVGGSTAGMTSIFRINGNSFPDQPASAARGEILLQTLEALNENHDINGRPHPNLNSLDNFHQHFFVHANSFTYDSDGGPEAHARKCGLSALGQNLQGSWETNALGGQNATSDPVQPLVILETKSVLEIGPSRSVRVVY